MSRKMVALILVLVAMFATSNVASATAPHPEHFEHANHHNHDGGNDHHGGHEHHDANMHHGDHDGSAHPGIDIEKFVRVVTSSSDGDLCNTFGKPTQLTMVYTGDQNPTMHSQDDGKVVVDGATGNASPVTIIAGDKSNPFDSKAKTYFDDIVALGGTFVIDSTVAGAAELKANTYVHVFDGETKLQTVKFHTSCSQPLLLGDQFGSALLIAFADKIGNGSVLPVGNGADLGDDADTAPGLSVTVGDAVVWSYVVTNTGNVDFAHVVVSDDQGVAVSCPLETLLAGESMICEATGFAIAGQYTNVGTATGDTVTGDWVMDSDPANYFGVVPVVNQCNGAKPAQLEMAYTGDQNPTSHSQADGKVVVDGTTGNASPVTIIASNKSNPFDSKAKTFFDGTVALGETFVIDATLAGEDDLKSNTYVHVFDGGTKLQTVKFHTSCSQPLFLGDQFGSVELVGFTAK